MHVDDLRYKPHPCELMLLTESHKLCFLLEVGTME